MNAAVAIQLLQVLAAIACTSLLLRGYRWVSARSRALGWILACGLLTRAVTGAALFWISYLHLPVASGLQLGDAFWRPATDAVNYVRFATQAVVTGSPIALDSLVPSPIYVNTLALVMWVLGISPAAGMFLNLCLYALVAVLLVWCFRPVDRWRDDLPCVLALGAYSASPMLLIHSTQPLKEEFSNFCLALACVGLFGLCRTLGNTPERRSRHVLVPVALLTVASFALAGTREYLAVLVTGTAAGALIVCGLFARLAPFRRYALATLAISTSMSLALFAGAGLDPSIVARGTARVLDISKLPRVWLDRLDRARVGFLLSGGATNLVMPVEPQAVNAGPVNARPPAEHDSASPSPIPGETAEMIAAFQAMKADAIRARRFRQGAGATRKSVHPPELRDAWTAAGTPPESLAAFKAMKAAAIRESRAKRARSGTTPSTATTPGRRPATGPLTDMALDDETPQVVLSAVPHTVTGHVKAAVIGVAVVCIPMSVLAHVSAITVSGNPELLRAADIDVIFLDVSVAAALLTLWRRRELIVECMPLVLFALLLSATTATLLGYVVTNFGTLCRLRSLAVMPLWLAMIALSPRPQRPWAGARVRGTADDDPDAAVLGELA